MKMDTDSKKEFLKRRERFLNQQYKTNLRQILSYLLDYKTVFIIILILGIVQSFLFLLVPLFFSPAMDVLFDTSRDITEVFNLFYIIIIIEGFVAVLFGVRIYVNRWIGANLIFNLRNDLFSTIQMMSWGWLDENKTGELLSRSTSDVNLLKEFLGNNLQFFVRELATFILSFVVLFIINVKLAFYVLITAPALFYILIIFRKRMRPVFRKSRETYADLTHVIQENVVGITVVKSFAREPHEIKKFTKENNQYYEDSMGIIKLQATFDPIIRLIDNIAFLLVLLVGGLLVFNAEMTFGQLFAFVLVLNFSIEPLYYITRFLANMPQITETCERLTHILNSQVIVKEKPKAIEVKNIKGEVEFKNVYFSFKMDSDYYILKDINLKVMPGETIAILGATGSGKSALVKLIPRFYDVSKGEILIDGINIKDFNLNSLRKQIGYVSQDRLLFSKSIKENIAFGKKDISLEEIKDVAIISDIHNFIEKELPKTYDTKVGERGSTLSGGQKQRVSIARALAIKPRILILDDCFSSVDVDTEYNIQKKLKNLLKNYTTFIITQRISTVRHADRIIVLENGNIIQSGTHEELLKQEGIYKKLYLTLKIEERA